MFQFQNMEESILVKFGISPLLGYSSLACLTKLPTLYYIFQAKIVSERLYWSSVWSAEVLFRQCCQLQEKSPLKYTFAQKLSCLNSKGIATESIEGNITAFRALV